MASVSRMFANAEVFRKIPHEKRVTPANSSAMKYAHQNPVNRPKSANPAIRHGLSAIPLHNIDTNMRAICIQKDTDPDPPSIKSPTIAAERSGLTTSDRTHSATAPLRISNSRQLQPHQQPPKPLLRLRDSLHPRRTHRKEPFRPPAALRGRIAHPRSHQPLLFQPIQRRIKRTRSHFPPRAFPDLRPNRHTVSILVQPQNRQQYNLFELPEYMW